ncbi:MAG TPA: hypothetical protein VJH92_01855 [Candidatus Nanoarchaeia archaeon]|nr:hypothetical protein [Candidatus Nanoarchaeia archaeon]
MKKVFVTSWHPSATNFIVPVVNELISRGCEVDVLGTKYSIPIFQKNNIPYHEAEYFGVEDYSPKSMEKLLRDSIPDVILAGTSFQTNDEIYIPDQTVLIASKKLGLPSMRVQDWFPYSKKYDDLSTNTRHIYMPDLIAVSDDLVKDRMISEGFKGDLMVVTGNPETASLLSKNQLFNNDARRQLIEKIGFNPGNILYYAGGIEWEENRSTIGYANSDHFEIFNQVLREEKSPEVGIIATLHPRIPAIEKERILSIVADIGDDRLRLVFGYDSSELTLSTQSTLTAFSTVGIKATYLTKPCISLQPNLIWPNEFDSGDIGYFVDNPYIPLGKTISSSKELVKSAFSPKFRQELESKLKESSAVNPGEASKNVVDLVLSL